MTSRLPTEELWMAHSFIGYIDEAGDDGLASVTG